MIRPRKTLRRGEPTKKEKQEARRRCRERAGGVCELQVSPECVPTRQWPLDGELGRRGELAHLHSKRRFGWMENDVQVHRWSCPACHRASHNCNGKPCPPKQSGSSLNNSLDQMID
jgi:hypothetical protein